MARKGKDKTAAMTSMPVINAKAAGIDVGSRFHMVAIGQGSDSVREFGVYSEDLKSLCEWLKSEGITTVALESTGSYWQILFLMLQDYDLNPILVSGKFTKNVQGKKTDVLDCQWIQKMHTMGLLPNSFQPDAFTEQLRQYTRHRQGLMENAADYIKKMQQALRLMNLRLDIVISDVTGMSGKAIITAIIEGQTDPKHLADLANYRVHKSKEEIQKALTGIFKAEYIFELKQSFELYEFFRAKIEECDAAIGGLLEKQIQYREQQDGEVRPQFDRTDRKKKNKNYPKIDIEKLAFQITGGIDFSKIDGVSGQTLLAIISEIGVDVSQFKTAKHFASWLRLAPNNKKTGGRVINKHTPKKKNKLSLALQRAANAIGNNLKSGILHQFFIRIKTKKGYMEAVVATARKLAVIIWNMLAKKEPFKIMDDELYKQQVKTQTIRNIQRKLKKWNIQPEELVFN
jgi:transposase